MSLTSPASQRSAFAKSLIPLGEPIPVSLPIVSQLVEQSERSVAQAVTDISDMSRMMVNRSPSFAESLSAIKRTDPRSGPAVEDSGNVTLTVSPCRLLNLRLAFTAIPIIGGLPLG